MSKRVLSFVKDRRVPGGAVKDQYSAASGLRKVADIPRTCTSPAHDPPTMIVLQPGVYEYTCPACGETFTFTVARVAW